MAIKHCCGPDHDRDFFNEIAAVMKRHPVAAEKYAIKCIDHETEIMGIDFAKKSGVSVIDGDTITTRFVSKSKTKGLICCLWKYVGGRLYCVAYWM